MSVWTFNPQTNRARGDALGAPSLNVTAKNMELLVRALLIEHGHPGASSKHNALEVPRCLGGMEYTGGAYTQRNFNAVRLTHTRLAAGSLEIEFDATNYYNVSNQPQQMLVNVNGDGPETKPHMAMVDWSNDAALPVIYIKKLSSALGSGDMWGATDANIDVALFALPFPNDSTSYLTPAQFSFGQGEGLRAEDDALTNIRGLVKNQGIWLSHLDEGHTTAGVHDLIEFPVEQGTITQSGGTYSLDADADFASVTKLATGQVEVTLNTTATSTVKMHPFVMADNSAGSGRIIANARSYGSPANKVRVYIFEWDGTGWIRADADFFLSVHAN